jgi:hypothetical protein
MAPAVAAAALWQALATSSSDSNSGTAADSSSSSSAVIIGGVQEWHALRVLQGIELVRYSDVTQRNSFTACCHLLLHILIIYTASHCSRIQTFLTLSQRAALRTVSRCSACTAAMSTVNKAVTLLLCMTLQ